MKKDFVHLRSAHASLLMRLLSWIIDKRPSPFPDDAPGVRRYLAERDPPSDAPLPSRLAEKYRAGYETIEGHECVTLHPAENNASGRHILYFHGGGFVLPIFKEHWPLVAALADATGASVTVPLYTVVPEGTRAAQDALADAVFARLAERHGAANVALAGDSAGGHMALSLALRLAEKDRQPPARLILFAPWLDLALKDENAAKVEKRDVMLRIDALSEMGRTFAEGGDPADPVNSPLRAESARLAKLPPTDIYVGRNDLFVVDCRSFAERLVEAGVETELYEYAGAPHVYMALVPTREAKDTMRLVARSLAAQSG